MGDLSDLIKANANSIKEMSECENKFDIETNHNQLSNLAGSMSSISVGHSFQDPFVRFSDTHVVALTRGESFRIVKNGNNNKETLHPKVAIELISNIISNTVFLNSKSKDDNIMTLFREGIKEELNQKCQEILEKYLPETIEEEEVIPPLLQFKKICRNSVMGTFLVGYINLTYDGIVEIFGEPTFGPSGDGKVDWEWDLNIKGEKITIYNYKTGPSYSSKNKDITPQDITDWHVGGQSHNAVTVLNEYIKQFLPNEDLVRSTK